ncbi:MAG TPA: hypothetical protein VFY23_00400 [Candidatus Limnocylindrales bacterium]|nr:hypothetical protein [Candidatus Limnocylindrales bacterium]
MTAPERFEQDLPQLLAQLAAGPRPDYRDSLVEAVARTPQRPAWAFPRRWLPVDITTAPVRTAPMPMRAVILAALLLLAVAATLLLVAGSRPRLPEPFGPARNGLIVYGNGGDIYAVNPDGTDVRPLVSDPATYDSDPLFSTLGDRMVFAREVDGAWELWITGADGANPRRLTERLIGLGAYAWSPDGAWIAAHHRPTGYDRVTLFAADGSSSRDLDLPVAAGEPLWRPGHAGQLLVRSQGVETPDLYLVDVATDTAKKLDLPHDPGAPIPTYDGQRPDWSPDGTRLVSEYGMQRYSDAGRPVIRLRVADVGADGTITAIRELEREAGADYEFGAVFLSTGDGIAFGLQTGCRFGVFVASGEDLAGAVPVGEPIDDCSNAGVGIQVAPDGTRALSRRTGDGADVMTLGGIDGTGRVVIGTTTDGTTWQRLAP